MIADRYYFNRLTPKEKEIYTKLYKGVTALEKEIYIPASVSQDEINHIFHAVTHDNPHLYYFNQTHMDIGKTVLPECFGCSSETSSDGFPCIEKSAETSGTKQYASATRIRGSRLCQ